MSFGSESYLQGNAQTERNQQILDPLHYYGGREEEQPRCRVGRGLEV